MYRYTKYCTRKKLPAPPLIGKRPIVPICWLKDSRYTSVWLLKLGFNYFGLQSYL